MDGPRLHLGSRSRSRRAREAWRAVEPARRPFLLVNPRSGGGAASRVDLVQRARERGIDAALIDAEHDLSSLIEHAVASGADCLGMAGGDGSLAAVATAAAAHDLPLVCVPAGTRNHFAMDLGVDRDDLVGSLDAFAAGVERTIDVAEVDGRLFLNNVSLGVYGDAVAEPAYRSAKARTLVETASRVLGPSGRVPDLRVVDDTGREHTRLAVILISNNPYASEPPLLGTRPSLDTGRLGVVLLDMPGQRPPLEHAWAPPDLEVRGAATVHAGIDGEAVDLDPPLRFTSRPAALRVRIPARRAQPVGL